jgi:hypothetical protein
MPTNNDKHHIYELHPDEAAGGAVLERENHSSNSDDLDALLVLDEFAAELRCSKAHASNVIHGKVRGVLPIPVIWIGSRPLIRRSTFEKWKAANETTGKKCYPRAARNSRGNRMGDEHA